MMISCHFRIPSSGRAAHGEPVAVPVERAGDGGVGSALGQLDLSRRGRGLGQSASSLVVDSDWVGNGLGFVFPEFLSKIVMLPM